jgi:hypothetical protein
MDELAMLEAGLVAHHHLVRHAQGLYGKAEARHHDAQAAELSAPSEHSFALPRHWPSPIAISGATTGQALNNRFDMTAM